MLRMPTRKDIAASCDILDAPDGSQRRGWDLLIVCLVLILCIHTPFEIVVDYYIASDGYSKFTYFMEAVFWLDMPINMFGAFYEGTELVTDRTHIIEHYMWGNPITKNRGWFWVDLIGNIPWEHFLAFDKNSRKSTKLVKLLKLPRLLRIGKLMKYMGQYVSFAMFIQVR